MCVCECECVCESVCECECVCVCVCVSVRVCVDHSDAVNHHVCLQDLYLGKTLFLLISLRNVPRLTLLYLFLFDYEDTFLPFIHTSCPATPDRPTDTPLVKLDIKHICIYVVNHLELGWFGSWLITLLHSFLINLFGKITNRTLCCIRIGQAGISGRSFC